MPTLIATPGAVDANAYATLDEANAYHDERLQNTDWLTTSEDDRKRGLIWATRILDGMVWKGSKAFGSTQALRWPRAYVPDGDSMHDPDRFVEMQGYLPSDKIPAFLRYATAELALFLIREDRTEGPAALQNNRVKAGSVEVEGFSYNMLPPAVTLLINPFLLGSNGFQVGFSR